MIISFTVLILMCNFRFDPAVIEQRKKIILEFLYYCAENPVIYRSQCFVKFFEDGSGSPKDEVIAIIGDEIDGMNSSVDEASLDLQSQNGSIELDDEPTEDVKNMTIDENSFDHLSTGFDYLYDAAICFSQAVQEEANLRYKPAFELYKVGIDKLLSGAKSDSNEKRKRIAKTKAGKYLERAEMLYENHIALLQEETFVFEDPTVDDTPSVLALERPVNNLSRFKVIGVTDYKMRVQDCTDKKFYVLKSIFKDSNCAILLPQSIPFMVKLVSYYTAENSIFLLFPLVSGGLLWNYINNYSSKSEQSDINLDSIFVEPPANPKTEIAPPAIETEDIPNDSDIELAEEIFAPDDNFSSNAIDAYINEQIAIPSFDTLSTEMDINDLMSCSQLLLQSVSKTLEKSQIQAKDKMSEDHSDPHIESFPEMLENPKKVEEIFAQAAEEIITEIHNEIAQLPETVLRQWASELIVAINSLHKAGVICGDLNLDNLLLGPQGHLTLTYFYKSDRNEYQQLCRLNPKAMKCLYVAFDFPLTKESDWYSVGVLIYEIFTRERFYLNHPMGVARFNEIQFSNPDALSDDVKNLLHGLIIESGENRLRYDDLVRHPFFETINFAQVEKCGLELFKF